MFIIMVARYVIGFEICGISDFKKMKLLTQIFALLDTTWISLQAQMGIGPSLSLADF